MIYNATLILLFFVISFFVAYLCLGFGWASGHRFLVRALNVLDLLFVHTKRICWSFCRPKGNKYNNYNCCQADNKQASHIYSIANRRPRAAGFMMSSAAVVMSAMLLAMAVVLSTQGWYARSNMLDAEFKQRSRIVASACIDTVILYIATNPVYMGGTPVAVGDGSCVVGDIFLVGNEKTFTVQAEYQNSYTVIMVTHNIETLEIVSWDELSTLLL